MKNSFTARWFVKPHIRALRHSSASLVAFFSVLACVLGCTCRDKPSWCGQLVCARVDNQRSRGVVIARLRTFVWSLLHQCRDLLQLTYPYLAEDWEPTSHQSLRHGNAYRIILLHAPITAWRSGSSSKACIMS
jgi:hypothetical protein